jgi:hypothetical protein
MIRTVQITDIDFDCSLDDEDWSLEEQQETAKVQAETYIGQIIELDVPDDASEDEIVDELLDEVSCMSGWCINSIDFRHILR